MGAKKRAPKGPSWRPDGTGLAEQGQNALRYLVGLGQYGGAGLLQDLRATQSDEEFDGTLSGAIDQIHAASVA